MAGHTNTIESPKHKVYLEILSMTMKVADKFGLTPVSAKRLGIRDKQKKKVFDRFRREDNVVSMGG